MDKFKNFIRQITPITDSEFASTIIYFKELRLKKRDYFVRQGEVCRQVAFIINGIVRIFYSNSKGEEITSGFCLENDFVTSFKSFTTQQPSELIIQAVDDTELLVVDHDSLQKLYAESRTWLNIGRIVTQNEYLVMEKYASVLSSETAKEKYLRLLKEQPTVLQKAPIEDIASYLGVTRRTLSRIRQEISE